MRKKLELGFLARKFPFCQQTPNLVSGGREGTSGTLVLTAVVHISLHYRTPHPVVWGSLRPFTLLGSDL
jgi:hypothetical protein